MSHGEAPARASNPEEKPEIVYPGDIHVTDEQGQMFPVYYALIPRWMIERGYVVGDTVQHARALTWEALRLDQEKVRECEGKTLDEARRSLSAILKDDFKWMQDESRFGGTDEPARGRFRRWMDLLDELIEVCAG